MLNIFLGEFLGTMFLIILGNGVVANVIFKKTIGSKSGFLAITVGWGLAVFVGVVIANSFHTGGHLNPAVTIMVLAKGDISIIKACVYFVSEFSGAIIGQIIISTLYFQHIKEKENASSVISMFSTGPTHKKHFYNLFSEFIGTAVLVSCAMLLVLTFGADKSPIMTQLIPFIGPFTMGLVVLSIGISLGGTTGYAINPFRDLAPRIVYSLMKFPNKPAKSANWKYSWVPVVAPMTAGLIVGLMGRIFM